MDKKAQITVFIIIGIVILLSASVLMYRRMASADTMAPASEDIVAHDTDSLKAFIEGCISKEAENLITSISKNGGTLLSDLYRMKDGAGYRYLCVNYPNYRYCTPTILTRQDMETELADAIGQNVKLCANLSTFRQQGIQITEGEVTADVKIAPESVAVTLTFPISAAFPGRTANIADFYAKTDLPLGKLHDLATTIINREATAGYFDQDDWMVQHGAEVKVIKHKPYPDTTYSLETVTRRGNKFSFKFAIEGKDALSDIGIPTPPLMQGGCCRNQYDNTCYANTVESDCTAKQGMVFDVQQPSCTCPGLSSFGDSSCGTDGCKDCEMTWNPSTLQYTGPKKKHGESWCVYEGPVGKGFDLVGSRHYKHSCIDGNEYVEECADYRQELCAEQNILGANPRTKAVCRPNRWQTCSGQTTKENCEDQTLRDCTWTDGLIDRSIPSYGMQRSRTCHPSVPPGFRHWELNGIQACASANEWRYCDGINCPDKWVDALAQYCYFQGDCGNYRNIAERITKGGYINTDNAERPATYLEQGIANKGRTYKLGLRLETRNQPQLNGKEYANLGHSPQEMMAAARAYYEEISTWDADEFLWQYMTQGHIDTYVFGAGICGTWQAPIGNLDCGRCSMDPTKPCTEYRCRSLGQGCFYEETDGTGICNGYDSGDKTPPSIDINESSLTPGYSALLVSFLNYSGFEITPKLKPHRKFTISITTDEPANCVLTPMPTSTGFTVPSAFGSFAYGAGTVNFTTDHTIEVNVPALEEAYERILDTTDVLGIDSFNQFSDFTKNYSAILSRFGKKYGIDMNSQIGALDRSIGGLNPVAVQDVVTNAAQKRYRLFVKCTDRAGNTNKENMFILIGVDDEGDDTTPPQVVNATPAAGSTLTGTTAGVHIFTDEHAECRYDLISDKAYEEMPNKFTCPASSYAVTRDGTYDCFANVNIGHYLLQQPIQLNIKCRDNPYRLEEFSIRLVQGQGFSITNSTQMIAEGLTLTPPSTINVHDTNVLKGGAKEIISSATTDMLHLNATNRTCRYSDDASAMFEKMQPMQCNENTCAQELPVNNKAYQIRCTRIPARQRNTGSATLSFVKG